MISAHLLHAASSLPTDASALESSISALESAVSALESGVKALDSSSAPWEYSVWAFTFLVVVGVVMELWVIRDEYREDMEVWALAHFGVLRAPGRPSIRKLRVEIISVLLIAIGVMGELGVGVKITSINGKIRGKSAELRSKNAELRTRSDQLVGLLHKETEDEQIARVEAEESAAWRRLTPDDRWKIKSELASFTIKRTWVQYNGNDVEAFNFGHDLAASVPASWNPTEPMPAMSFREGPVPLGKYGPLERGIRVTAVGDKSYVKAANVLTRLLSSLGFDCQKSDDALIKNLQYAPMIVVSVDPRPEGRQGEAKLKAEARRQAIKTTTR